jgi:hypothetical protein
MECEERTSSSPILGTQGEGGLLLLSQKKPKFLSCFSILLQQYKRWHRAAVAMPSPPVRELLHRDAYQPVCASYKNSGLCSRMHAVNPCMFDHPPEYDLNNRLDPIGVRKTPQFAHIHPR